jgi:dCTP deaminase
MFLAESDIVLQLSEWRKILPDTKVTAPIEEVHAKVESVIRPRREEWHHSSQLEKAKGPAGAILVYPYPAGIENTDRTGMSRIDAGIKGAACHLHMGDEVFLTSEETPRRLSQKSPFLSIEPGEFAVLITNEYVYLPDDIIGFISVRNTYKQKGIVSVSGFHVDPGFQGRLTFTVYNAGPNSVPIRLNDLMFIITFAEITRPTPPYEGVFSAQTRISAAIVTSLQGPSLSPRNLDERLRRLEIEVRVLLAPLAAAIIAAILSFFR